jgi:hypothetical protein
LIISPVVECLVYNNNMFKNLAWLLGSWILLRYCLNAF